MGPPRPTPPTVPTYPIPKWDRRAVRVGDDPQAQVQRPSRRAALGRSAQSRGEFPFGARLRFPQDIRNQRRYRQHRREELLKLRQTLRALDAKTLFYEEQIDYYNQYIRSCLDGLAASNKYVPFGREPPPRSQPQCLSRAPRCVPPVNDGGAPWSLLF